MADSFQMRIWRRLIVSSCMFVDGYKSLIVNSIQRHAPSLIPVKIRHRPPQRKSPRGFQHPVNCTGSSQGKHTHMHTHTQHRHTYIREWTGLEFGKSQRAVENREKWRKLVAKSSVVPQRPSRLRDWRWWWWWWWWCWWWWWWFIPENWLSCTHVCGPVQTSWSRVALDVLVACSFGYCRGFKDWRMFIRLAPFVGYVGFKTVTKKPKSTVQ